MARHLTETRATDTAQIKAFTAGGYAFDPDLSEGDKWVFVRPYPDTK